MSDEPKMIYNAEGDLLGPWIRNPAGEASSERWRFWISQSGKNLPAVAVTLLGWTVWSSSARFTPDAKYTFDLDGKVLAADEACEQAMAALRRILDSPRPSMIERARLAMADTDGVELRSDEDVDALFDEIRRGRRARRSQVRVPWDTYFLNIARETATRATCDRKYVGAVIVRDRSILATGYNGSVRGMPHCDDVGCDVVEGHCVRTVHAESNAVAQAARNGVRIDGATIYCTASPCLPCLKLVANAGIVRIVFAEPYGSASFATLAKEMGIEYVDLCAAESAS